MKKLYWIIGIIAVIGIAYYIFVMKKDSIGLPLNIRQKLNIV